ncbi:cytochrome D1 domain-containing protein [Paucibacter sp. APW11]|uniref:Cytochrome D1 domain-containing protein n=1 Tax=Roseateles aquae TaxID=3077235 RepID=A0ABU3P746_9BURK|nr:cytochrome D1 domain-containing protein [Paucibacter sp. APW11]MDT8998040.1 cytochrome D1 domain-containing protein [Paucibacter sp. APW11]
MKTILLKTPLKLALAAAIASLGLDYARAEPGAAIDASGLYQQYCASCHGAQRLGGMGPALLPESLERLRKPEALKVISQGRAATQMQGFAERLQEAEIKALAAYIYQPVTPAPQWSDADISASRRFDVSSSTWPARPQWRADPMNLFVVVEGGDHHVSLVDGDKFEPIHRFASRFALHGGPKFSPDGRYVYFGSRDGWISKYDLWNLKLVAEVRAGLNMRNVAVSADGRWVMAANYLPHTAVLFDADLNLVKRFDAKSLDGQQSSRVSAVYDAAPRHSFVVALKDVAELWEISYDEGAAPIHDGLVHDYRMGEALAKPGYLNPRRTPLEEALDDFFFDDSYRHVLGAARPRGDGEAMLGQVVNLDVRRKIATLPIAGMPHLGSGISFNWQGRRVMASPNLKDGRISVVDMKDWSAVREIATPGPGFFMRSHARSRYAWADSMMSAGAKDTLSIIDKQTLEVVAQVREPGKTLAHVEFTKDGRHVLASLWEMDGALIVYDAANFKEVKRVPMSKPVGKYNVWNKISRDEGTSH